MQNTLRYIFSTAFLHSSTEISEGFAVQDEDEEDSMTDEICEGLDVLRVSDFLRC